MNKSSQVILNRDETVIKNLRCQLICRSILFETLLVLYKVLILLIGFLCLILFINQLLHILTECFLNFDVFQLNEDRAASRLLCLSFGTFS